MFSMNLLFQGFASAISPVNLLWALVGSTLGTLVGVLPGIGPSSAIAILLPLTTFLAPTPAIIMMAAIYYGAMYGGSTTAIVVNIPGEASSVPTALDGYEMAKQGRAGPALAISAISSWVAGTIGIVGLTFFAPILASFALSFGPPEYFALMFMGLSLIISLSGKALFKGIIGAAFGLLISLVGQNPLTGAARLTFGSDDLLAGVNFISIIIGLFALGEVFTNVEQRVALVYNSGKIDWLPKWADIWMCRWTMVRSSLIGFFMGLLPGCAPAVTTFVAYDIEKRCSKTPERFGKGAIEGVAAPEGANNATSSAGFVPLFAFGLPTGPALAVLLGGFMMYGLQPGPLLFQNNAPFVWAVIASMYLGNIICLILNLPLIPLWARIARIPFPVLGPLIVLFSVIGAYSIRFLMFDVWVALLFGVIGYFMRKLRFPVAPLVLSTVLASMLETSLSQSLMLSGGSLGIFFTRPISLCFIALALASIARGLWMQVKSGGVEALSDADD
ncbi:tripartite tricarboxylate transporter permease [Solidesulfovibrio sp.]|uniref:tripartite tricarboxylate transporter permease n=1 Tax=Solidesulfovibrio sp. TaxID=2910990 RepID=UPI002604AF2E|nr:tripartite tricarboxylate transporter permease [Solidesulfovibrio sp.]